MHFSHEEVAACRRLIELALAEDLGSPGDLTSQATIPPDLEGRAVFAARAAGVLAGLPAAELVVQMVDARVRFSPLRDDGHRLQPGAQVALVEGPMRGILALERTALNLLQHLSGIATLTRRYVDAVAGLPARILDTRKTLPGYRLLAKYAVRCGGGHNHRMGLHDGILIKDNHLSALESRGAEPSPIRVAVERARAAFPHVPVEIEVDNLKQFEEALAAAPDIILLDNLSPAELRTAVARRDALVQAGAKRPLLEASGGVTLDTVRTIAATGVERISVGALTHSAPALDIGLDYQ